VAFVVIGLGALATTGALLRLTLPREHDRAEQSAPRGGAQTGIEALGGAGAEALGGAGAPHTPAPR
jgi:hypothetical protein